MDSYLGLPEDNRGFGVPRITTPPPPTTKVLPNLADFALKCRGCSFTAAAGSTGLQLAIMHEQNPPEDCVQDYGVGRDGWEIG